MAKKVLIALSGSISAYKIADVVSELGKRGIETQCLLTEAAARFVSPLVLETLSGRPALTDLFGAEVSGTEHIALARWADLVVFAPASADLLARLALGLGDDLVTTVALATDAPLLIAPAMNTSMWNKPVVQQHVETLCARGARFVAPASGLLACGEVGVGKLAGVSDIVAAIEAALAPPAAGDLAGRRILITAGPTTTAIDAVRYITNHSTGRMGAALAEAALRRGAEVFHVLGIDKGVVRPMAPPGAGKRLHLIEVRTAEEMARAALAALPGCAGVIAAAAVMDYRVAAPVAGKLKRGTAATTLDMVPSTDVLEALRDAAAPGQWFFGFAAETDDVEANGRAKLDRKRLDFLFANPVARAGETAETGFSVTTNGGVLLRREGAPVTLPVMDKAALADTLLDYIA